MNSFKINLFNKEIINKFAEDVPNIYMKYYENIRNVLELIQNYDYLNSFFEKKDKKIYKNNEFLKYLDEIKNHNLKVSCIILTKNEEQYIEECLKSIENCFDEIVIIDTGSTDNTISKILQLNISTVNIYSFEWVDDFSSARNFGISKAKSDCIFFIDADECLEKTSYEQLHDILNIFYFFPYKERLVLSPSIIDLQTGQHHINVHRIFFKNNFLKYYGRVHEEIRSNHGKIINLYLKINIIHKGYMYDRMINKDKINRNLFLLEKQLCETPDEVRWIYMYVRDGISILDENQLERILINTILINPKGKININNLKDNEYIFGLLTCLCMIYLRKNKLSQIENITNIMEMLIPNNSNSFYFKTMARYILSKNELKKLLVSSMQYRKNNFNAQIGMINDEGYHIDYLIGIILFDLYEFDSAEKYFAFLENKFKYSEFDIYIKKYRKMLKK